MRQAIGIFGGTFAPIHNGHLRLAIELRERLKLDQVRLIPSLDPPHRDTPRISAQRRLDWVRLACAGERELIVDEREIQRNGRSFSYDTLRSLRADFPDAALLLLIGADAANQFHTWHRWREIPQLAHLLFVERPYEPARLAPELQELLGSRRAQTTADLHARASGLFMHIALPPLAISSTRIRALLKAGRSVRGLLPQSVIDSFTPEDINFLTYDEIPAND